MVFPDISIVLPYSRHILQLSYKKIDFLENWSLSYITRDICNFIAQSLFVSTESDECKEQLNDLEFRVNNKCAPKLNMLDNWDIESVAIDKVFLPTKKYVDVLFMKLTQKKLNYKDAVTEYLSSNLCTIILDNICTVVKNGLSIPYTGPKVDYTPLHSQSYLC